MQYSKSGGGSAGNTLWETNWGVSAPSVTLHGCYCGWVVTKLLRLIVEGCFPVMCSDIVRFCCYLVYNYIATLLSWYILSANQFEVLLDKLAEK